MRSAVFVRVMRASMTGRYFFFEAPFLGGTFAPERRASERPIAIACLRLVTFFPDRPERSLPCFFSFIARSTFSPAFLPYFGIHPPARRNLQSARLSRDRRTCCAPSLPRRGDRHRLRSYAGRESSYRVFALRARSGRPAFCAVARSRCLEIEMSTRRSRRCRRRLVRGRRKANARRPA